MSRVSVVASSSFDGGTGVCVPVSQRNQSTCTYICVMAGRTGQYHRNHTGTRGHACYLRLPSSAGTSDNMSFSPRTCWLSSRSRGVGAVGAPLHHSHLQPDHRGRTARCVTPPPPHHYFRLHYCFFFHLYTHLSLGGCHFNKHIFSFLEIRVRSYEKK